MFFFNFYPIVEKRTKYMLVEGRRTRLRGHVHTFKSNHIDFFQKKGLKNTKKTVEDLLKKIRIKLKTVSNNFHS